MRYRTMLLSLVFVWFDLTSAKAETRLPSVPKLAADVTFWENVFSRYRASQCVVHDSEHLDAIFLIANVPSERRPKVRAIARHLQKVRKALTQLGGGLSATTWMQKRVVRGTPASLRTPTYWKAAAARLRCQRGVKFHASIERSKRYLGMVKGVFKKYGLPEDLAYLPILESGYNPRALSHAGARGLWQFMPSQGRRYGLTVNRHVDHRIDPYRSTIAAAKLLSSLKDSHKTWPLAITAYNYGTNGMRRAIEKFGHDYLKIRREHRTRIFGFAVKNYYPSVLAVRNVIERDHETLAEQASELMTYRVRPGDNLSRIAQKFDATIHSIRLINELANDRIYVGQRLKVHSANF